MHPLAKLDHQYIWHPFTQMRDWLKHEPIVIAEAKGAVLRDLHGQEYLDANSSIWTNLHGHNHPRLNAAIRRQLSKIAHSSALGFANEPASLLAEQLVRAANRQRGQSLVLTTLTPPSPQAREKGHNTENRPLSKVFFSDDGSTAMEVALKLSYEFARRSFSGRRPRFLSLEGAYHGDTVGAVSLGHIDLFHRAYSGLLFKTDTVMAPYCYRCPFNRAKPERADAREYRRCNWECLGQLERKFSRQAATGTPYSTFVFEPLIQGAAGMIAQPDGWLRRAAQIARGHGAQLIADEIMTGFGRTGAGLEGSRGLSPPLASQRTPTRSETSGLKSQIAGSPPVASELQSSLSSLFACHHEGVQPDFLALAKGLSGGYLPMAATLTTEAVFEAFLGDYEEFKTFFHGHSFTANQLGAAAAVASLELLNTPASCRARLRLQTDLRDALQLLWPLRTVGDIRQVGLVAGIELVRNWRTREPFDLRERAGIGVCDLMAKRGVLTRPIGNVIVLMPPYCTTRTQVQIMVGALHDAISEWRRKENVRG
jgi:adenosylmethionine---8-amino-7-oxononanoate aminotransferase